MSRSSLNLKLIDYGKRVPVDVENFIPAFEAIGIISGKCLGDQKFKVESTRLL